MKHLTAAKAATTLTSAYASGDLVDTHQFERDAMANFPAEFMQDFLAYNCDLTKFSRDFSLWIKRDWSALVTSQGKTTSLNLLNNNSENENWKIK